MRITASKSALGATIGVALAALLLVACNGGSSDATATTEPGSAIGCPTDGEDFEVARLYIEHNATDEDTGVHGLFGGEAWRSLCITSPGGARLLEVSPLAALRNLGLADLFFESREPENDQLSIADLRARFPEGDYTVAGIDIEGVARVGDARFTHAIPAEPEILAPALHEEPELAEASPTPREDLLVRWEPVTETIDGAPAEIVAYEVIVTNDDHEDPDALSRPVYDVHVPASVTELLVPAAFFQPDTTYELEVLAIEASGNQTIALGFFHTE